MRFFLPFLVLLDIPAFAQEPAASTTEATPTEGAAPAEKAPSNATQIRQRLQFEAITLGAFALEQVRVEVSRFGSTEELILSDGNDLWWSTPFDGVYAGEIIAPFEPYLAVKLYIKVEGQEEQQVFDGVVRTEDPDQAAVAWWIQQHNGGYNAKTTPISPPFAAPSPPGFSATTVPLPYPPATLPFRTSVGWMIASWWTLLVLGYVGWLAGRKHEK